MDTVETNKRTLTIQVNQFKKKVLNIQVYSWVRIINLIKNNRGVTKIIILWLPPSNKDLLKRSIKIDIQSVSKSNSLQSKTQANNKWAAAA